MEQLSRRLPPPTQRRAHPEPDLERLVGHAIDLVSDFRANAEAVDAVVLSGLDELGDWLRVQDLTRGWVEPSLQASLQSRWRGVELDASLRRVDVTEAKFGITPAVGGVATTGTVILDDSRACSRLGALAPWVHVALLDPLTLYRSLPRALEHLGTSPGVVWVTGPSKTADVEGILIHGAHGPGIQVICLVEELARLESRHALVPE